MFNWLRSVRKRRRRLTKRKRRQHGGGSNPYFKVKYGDVEVAGQTLRKDLTCAIPSVELATSSGDLYTLIMDDPDSQTKFPFIHWFVINIKGSDFSSGEAVYDYEGPTSKHRYVFQLYKQLLGSAPRPKVPADRSIYDKQLFIRNQQLQPVGSPLYFFVKS